MTRTVVRPPSCSPAHPRGGAPCRGAVRGRVAGAWSVTRAASVAVVVLLVALMGVLAGGPVRAAADEVPPEPPLVDDGEVDDGQVRLVPTTQTVADSRVEWLLSNGGESPLTFRLAVHEVVATDDGIDLGEPREDLPLATDRLRLAPGEVARVPLDVPADAGGGAFALVARTIDAAPEATVSGLALRSSDVGVVPTVVEPDARAGTFTVRLDADGTSLVDVALRASAWPGTFRTEHVIEDVLVPAGGRDLEVALDGMLAGRVHLDVVVAAAPGGSGPTTRASTAVWWWPPATAWLVGLVLVASALVVAGWIRRRGPVA